MIHHLSSEAAREEWQQIQLYKEDPAKDQLLERDKTDKTRSVTRASLQQVLIQQVLQFHQLLETQSANQLLSILVSINCIHSMWIGTSCYGKFIREG